MKRFENCNVCARKWTDDCLKCLRDRDPRFLMPEERRSLKDYFVEETTDE